MRFVSLAIVLGLTISATQAEARRSHRVQSDANGNSATTVVSHKTGARASVNAQYAAKFQAYIDDLEEGGATVKFMGGTRRGHCSSRHMHPCGRALDVCQLRRGVVDRRCNLPDRSAIAVIASRHGLFEGGQWCNHDYGHAQVGVSAAACGERTMAARSRHHRRSAQTVAAVQTNYSSDWQQFNAR